MGVLSKDMCQVYKLLFGNEIRTNGIARFYEADPIPAIFYFINSAIFYRVLCAFVYFTFCHFVEHRFRFGTDTQITCEFYCEASR